MSSNPFSPVLNHLKGLPDLAYKVDVPADTVGGTWWLDLASGTMHAEVCYHRSHGFGLWRNQQAVGFGMKPDFIETDALKIARHLADQLGHKDYVRCQPRLLPVAQDQPLRRS